MTFTFHDIEAMLKEGSSTLEGRQYQVEILQKLQLLEAQKQARCVIHTPRHAGRRAQALYWEHLMKRAEQEGKQVARVGYTHPPIYCIVDDDLQPT